MINLKKVREAKHLSQSELSRRAGLCATTISTIESGRLKPYENQKLKIAKALKWSGDVEELFEEVD